MTFGEWHDFEVPLANAEVLWVKERVRAYRWFEEPVDASWQYGANQEYLRRLQRYWLDHYSWRHAVAQLNALPHFKVDVGKGFHLHCVHRRAADPAAIPLLLCHGWPGSVAEFTPIIEQLAEPADPSMPSFHVVAPSLPGYGWSDKPSAPIGPRKTAQYYDRLMKALGYENYIAQGGDWGSMVSAWLGLEGAGCAAVHLNGYGLSGADMTPQTTQETQWQVRARKARKSEMAYLSLQATKPQSLSYAMMDSPMGIAAWFAEKFGTWGDRDASASIQTQVPVFEDEDDPLADGELKERVVLPAALPTDPPFSMDWLLTNLMIYLTTRSFNTATWMYRGMVEEGGFSMPEGAHIERPVGVANFPKDLLAFPPRTMVERDYNVQHWSDMPRGGHFASVEEPDLFISELQDFARTLLKQNAI